MPEQGEDPTGRRNLVVIPIEGVDPEIGRWLWAAEDTRGETRAALRGVDAAELEWSDDGDGNTIATILVHLVAIELDWLYAEVLEREIPADVLALLPPSIRDPQGQLTVVAGLDADALVSRLDAARARLLSVYREMTVADFRRPRHLERYDVTPEWVLHHLIQHEAEHRGEIGAVRTRARRALGRD